MMRSKGVTGYVEFAIRHKKIIYAIVGILAIAGIVSLKYMNKDEFLR